MITRYRHFEKCNCLWWNADSWSEVALKKGFEKLVNQNDASSRYLANYLNDLLFGTRNADVTHDRCLDEMKTIASLYDTIWEKDVFERHHQLFFMNRLVNKLSSLEFEQHVIHLLRPSSCPLGAGSQ
jgi:hypothetical protein